MPLQCSLHPTQNAECTAGNPLISSNDYTHWQVQNSVYAFIRNARNQTFHRSTESQNVRGWK